MYKVTYSLYQAQKQGLLSRTYNLVDVKVIQAKIMKIQRHLDLSILYEFGASINKFWQDSIKKLESNIEFICRQINQQIMEK